MTHAYKDAPDDEPDTTGALARERTRAPVLKAALHTRRGQVGMALAGIVVVIAAVGPAVAPDSAPAFVTISFVGAAGLHLLGGDVLGRDVLSRVLQGGWEILLMAVVATVLGVAAGACIGVAAAFEGRKVDALLMRSMDVVLAFPQIVFGLLLVSVVGPKVWLIVLAVAITHAPQVARVLRAAALDVCERDFVKAAELCGLPRRRMLRSEILPSLTSPLMVESGLRLTFSIIIIAGLSFLGFGLQPPSPNWGAMINENRIGLAANLWGVVVPVALLAVLTIGINTLTDAIARAAIGLDGGIRQRGSTRRRAAPIVELSAITNAGVDVAAGEH